MAKFLKLVSILFIIYKTNLIQINANEYNYELDSDLNYDYYSEGLNESHFNHRFNSSLNSTDDYEYNSEEEDEEECSLDIFIDEYIYPLLPEDYEENKKLDFTQKSFTFHETINRIKRLNEYKTNISRKSEPILKQLGLRLSELLFYMDLPADCMTGMARIGEAAKNQELWALKCK